MSLLLCPKCEKPTLKIDSVEVEPLSSMTDEELIQALECGECNYKGLGWFTDSRRGPIDDSDTIYHIAYKLDEESFANLKKAMADKNKIKEIHKKRFADSGININFDEYVYIKLA